MVARTNKNTGGEFLGCSQWPTCTETQEMPTYVRLLRQGAAQLPGMEEL
jgi:ssDNA-binding Zn-finger/Zn-ribbon topoisomerase 1